MVKRLFKLRKEHRSSKLITTFGLKPTAMTIEEAQKKHAMNLMTNELTKRLLEMELAEFKKKKSNYLRLSLLERCMRYASFEVKQTTTMNEVLERVKEHLVKLKEELARSRECGIVQSLEWCLKSNSSEN
jgi:hypothetical protein